MMEEDANQEPPTPPPPPPRTLGTGGRRPKTVSGQKTAILQFNKFVATHPEGVGTAKLNLKYEQRPRKSFTDKLLYNQFSFYLAVEAVKDAVKTKRNNEAIPENEDGEVLMVSTALQYFSNFLNAVLNTKTSGNMTPEETQFFGEFESLKKGESTPWIKSIREDMRSEMERNLIIAGIPMYIKAKGAGRMLMQRIIIALIDGVGGIRLTSFSY
jgi:hypothetical protein